MEHYTDQDGDVWKYDARRDQAFLVAVNGFPIRDDKQEPVSWSGVFDDPFDTVSSLTPQHPVDSRRYRDNNGGVWEELPDGSWVGPSGASKTGPDGNLTRLSVDEDAVAPAAGSVPPVEEGGTPQSSDAPMPRVGSYVKPVESVYRVVRTDARDRTMEIEDVDTGVIHSVLEEFYTESKPPRPKLGQVWVREDVAYFVAEWMGSASIKLTSPWSELVVPNEELEESAHWRRIH